MIPDKCVNVAQHCLKSRL